MRKIHAFNIILRDNSDTSAGFKNFILFKATNHRY